MPKKILVIDDEIDFINILTMRLKATGYETVAALDGRDGLDKARRLNPDLIILDIMMPKMDGYEVCRLLKFDEKYKSIPIIMLTAKTQVVDKTMGGAVGADDYITKPFESDELIKKVKSILGK